MILALRDQGERNELMRVKMPGPGPGPEEAAVRFHSVLNPPLLVRRPGQATSR